MANTLLCPFCGEKRTVEMEYGSFRCPLCRTSFKREDEESLAESFRSLTFDLKKLGGERVRIILSSLRGGEVRTYRVFSESRAPVSGEMKREDWMKIARTLFVDAHFESWKHTSYDPQLSDGMTWTLTVSFERKHSLSCHGCNGYPPYWNEVIVALSFCLEALGLNPSEYLSKRKEPS